MRNSQTVEDTYGDDLPRKISSRYRLLQVMMSDLLFRRWRREHQLRNRYRQFGVLKSTIFVISTLWTDLVARVAALEAYILYMNW